MLISKPETEQILIQRCQGITGRTLSELANAVGQKIPHSLHYAKGWIGQLIELHLGADSHNKSQPDFLHLNIELKTIPLNANHLPRESTYVCTAPSGPTQGSTSTLALETWETSRVRRKLARVLWVPIEAAPHIPIGERHVGSPLLWTLPSAMENILKQDWEELTEMLQLGQVANISAKQGVYLQIRPKAAHSRILASTINEQGEVVLAGPKGFYLRSLFTQKILTEHYL